MAGAREVAMPVVFSVTDQPGGSFLPLMFLPGFMGKIFKVIPMVVIAVFSISLIESLFILPAHLGHQQTEAPPSGPSIISSGGRKSFSHAFEILCAYRRYGAFLAVMPCRRRYSRSGLRDLP